MRPISVRAICESRRRDRIIRRRARSSVLRKRLSIPDRLSNLSFCSNSNSIHQERSEVAYLCIRFSVKAQRRNVAEMKIKLRHTYLRFLHFLSRLRRNRFSRFVINNRRLRIQLQFYLSSLTIIILYLFIITLTFEGVTPSPPLLLLTLPSQNRDK